MIKDISFEKKNRYGKYYVKVINGIEVYHREDGPAIDYPFTYKSWYINGKLHRENGPAIEYINGEKHWYINGDQHRIDGPAIERPNGTKVWYYKGQHIFVTSQEDFELYLKNLMFK